MNIFIRTNSNDLLKYLNDTELLVFNDFAVKYEVSKDKLLNNEDDFFKDIYVIESGAVRISVKKQKKEIIIEDCHEGEIIWLSTLITGEQSEYSFKTLSECTLIKYNILKLEQIMINNPLVASKIQSALNDSLCEKHITITQKLKR